MTYSDKVYLAFDFWVEIDDIREAQFKECSGLQSSIKYDTVEEGGLNGYVHLLPVRTEYSPLSIKRGISSNQLWSWYYDCTQGRIVRRTISIFLYLKNSSADSEGRIQWDVAGAWPIKWVGPTFDAGANAVAFESIELAHRGFKRVA